MRCGGTKWRAGRGSGRGGVPPPHLERKWKSGPPILHKYLWPNNILKIYKNYMQIEPQITYPIICFVYIMYLMNLRKWTPRLRRSIQSQFTIPLYYYTILLMSVLLLYIVIIAWYIYWHWVTKICSHDMKLCCLADFHTYISLNGEDWYTCTKLYSTRQGLKLYVIAINLMNSLSSLSGSPPPPFNAHST